LHAAFGAALLRRSGAQLIEKGKQWHDQRTLYVIFCNGKSKLGICPERTLAVLLEEYLVPGIRSSKKEG